MYPLTPNSEKKKLFLITLSLCIKFWSILPLIKLQQGSFKSKSSVSVVSINFSFNSSLRLLWSNVLFFLSTWLDNTEPLKLIKHLWDELQHKLQARSYHSSSLPSCIYYFVADWVQIPAGSFQNLVESLQENSCYISWNEFSMCINSAKWYINTVFSIPACFSYQNIYPGSPHFLRQPANWGHRVLPTYHHSDQQLPCVCKYILSFTWISSLNQENDTSTLIYFVCLQQAQSSSRSFTSLLDGGLNYCNLYDLLTGERLFLIEINYLCHACCHLWFQNEFIPT